MPGTAIVWFRRDLRVTDHPALVESVAAHEQILPLFVHDPRLIERSGANRLAFLHGCLDSLDATLDGALVERVGDPVDVVTSLARDVDAAAVYVTEDFAPYGRERDRLVVERLAAIGVSFHEVGTPYVVAPGTLRTKTGTPYKVFTPFSRAWRTIPRSRPLDAPDRMAWVRDVASDERPTTPEPTATSGLQSAGEAAAHRLLESFVDHDVRRYGTDRDRPDLDTTSRLSPHLKFGTIHPRQLLDRLGEVPDAAGSRGAEVWESELIWRDFYADVLLHRPDTVRQNFVDTLDGLVWDDGPEADERFGAWCAGRTGYPIVDAGMRQLLAEGWMHNRVRMIVASFLTKDLHIHWRRGASWFMAHLVDGDVASNQHGWQWTAGTGTDASPFFRVFNPIAQGRRFDPSGDYVRRYVPELADVDGPTVHEPRDASGSGSLFDAEASRGSSYPAPIVDHAAERAEALARWNAR